jgi:hypothetical protein
LLSAIPSWADAKFGVAANVIALAGVVYAYLAQKP